MTKIAFSLGYRFDVDFAFKSRPRRKTPSEESEGVSLIWTCR
jgi:hypothetical protein